MKILVTGAGGLVGSGIASYLASTNNDEIFTTSRQKKEEKNHIYCDLFSDDLTAALSGLDVDAIVHCAAVIPASFSDSAESYRLNKKIDENVLCAAKKLGARLIYISSITIYGLSSQNRITEESAVELFSDYIVGKYETEKAIQAELKDYMIFRISSPYGPNQKSNSVIKIFINRAKNGLDLVYYGSGSRTQNFIHVKDIGRAVERALSYQASDIFNIAGDESISMRRLAETISDIANSRLGTTIHVYASGFEDPQEDVRSDISIEKADRLLGWRPEISIRDGMVEWMDAG